MKSTSSSLVIIVNAFSRAESLERCLASIQNSTANFDIPIVVIHQRGSREVEQVLLDHSSLISHVRLVNGQGRTPLENINHNRLLGYQIAFNDYKADWVIAIEEDVVLSKDAISFVRFVLDRYVKNRFFRGINFGSREPFSADLIDTYSLLRYGMHGQGSVIGRRTWDFIIRREIENRFSTHGFDSLIEQHLKLGFMVTPNLSRSLDTGWDGTHMPDDKNDSYFTEMRESFVGDIDAPSSYQQLDLLHRWREDLEVYKLHKTPRFVLRSKWYELKHEIKKSYLRSAA
jgi:hypothetical protein